MQVDFVETGRIVVADVERDAHALGQVQDIKVDFVEAIAVGVRIHVGVVEPHVGRAVRAAQRLHVERARHVESRRSVIRIRVVRDFEELDAVEREGRVIDATGAVDVDDQGVVARAAGDAVASIQRRLVADPHVVTDRTDEAVHTRGQRVRHRGDGQRDRGRARAAMAVVGRVDEAVRTEVVGRRRVDEGTTRTHRDRAVARLRRHGVVERVAVDIGGSDLARDGLVFAARGGQRSSDRRVIHGGDADADAVDRGQAAGVGDLEAEAVGAVVIRVRRVGVRTGGAERDRAVGRLRDEGEGLGVAAVNVGRRDGAADRGVFERQCRAAVGYGSVVHSSDGDRCGCGGRGASAVRHLVGEGVSAVEVGVRNVDEAGAVEADRAVGRLRVHRVGRRIADIDVGRDGRHGDAGGVFLAGTSDVDGHGRVIHRSHVHRGDGGRGGTRTIGDGVGEAVDAVEVGNGHIDEPAQADVERDGAMQRRGADCVGQRVAGVGVGRRRRDVDRSVFVARSDHGQGGGRVIRAGDSDRQRAGRGELAVGHGDVDHHGARCAGPDVVVGRVARIEGVDAIAAKRQAGDRRLRCGERIAQGIAFEVAVVGRQRTGDGSTAFGGAVGVGNRDGRSVRLVSQAQHADQVGRGVAGVDRILIGRQVRGVEVGSSSAPCAVALKASQALHRRRQHRCAREAGVQVADQVSLRGTQRRAGQMQVVRNVQRPLGVGLAGEVGVDGRAERGFGAVTATEVQEGVTRGRVVERLEQTDDGGVKVVWQKVRHLAFLVDQWMSRARLAAKFGYRQKQFAGC